MFNAKTSSIKSSLTGEYEKACDSCFAHTWPLSRSLRSPMPRILAPLSIHYGLGSGGYVEVI